MSNGSKSKSSSARTGRRREELRRTLPKQTFNFKAIIQQPEFVNTALITLGFLLLASLITIWSRDQLKVETGQIMTDTRLKRLDYSVADQNETNTRREEARNSAPHVYVLNTAYLDRLAAALNGLPIAVSGKTTIDEIAPDLTEEFRLTEPALRALAPFAIEGQTTQEWRQWVDNLTRVQLPAHPLIGRDDFQTYWVARQYSTPLKRLLLGADGALIEIPRDADAIELAPDAPLDAERRLQQIVLSANFPPEVVPYIAAKLATDAQPTIYYGNKESQAQAEAAEAAVDTVFVKHRKGEVIYRRGDRLSAQQYDQLLKESVQFAAEAGVAQRWLPRLATVGLIGIVSVFLVGYIVLFYLRIVRNPMRLIAVCSLMVVMLAISALVGARAPSLSFLGAVAPTIFVAIVMLLAYDQRIALFVSAIQCALATFAIEQRIGMFVLLFAGCGVAVAQLREMRHRHALIRASGVTASVLAVGTILFGVLVMPMVEGAWKQILLHGFWAGFGSFAVGFVVLGILPSLEKWFDITTGMTLAELRDPKQALLKQLQQKAPGTYNHSLQVANIAEAAAEAIGANGLLVYVGALYHDIGKMNKPEYFVENTEGQSKHDKLSPAMSLLVIVGHVKDGIELAREYGLPRSIQHFIESHHGTTLVEYFYHAAKSRAEGGDVEEIEFRYPGPKPRTKEAAILMLADAVESATRSMADPNPSRIESLVRKLSRKRLTDGQYDQCDLTFRELGLIEESTIKSLCAIYHGRISYPSQREEEKKEAAAVPEPVKSASA